MWEQILYVEADGRPRTRVLVKIIEAQHIHGDTIRGRGQHQF